MKITVTGTLYSGKSTLVKGLAKELNLKTYSVGSVQRSEAEKLGMTISEYNQYVLEHGMDNEIDKRTESIGKTETDFVFDGRMAWHFIPDSIKICLTVDLDEACKRALADNGRTSESYQSLEDAKKGILNRQGDERERFIKLYGVDKQLITNYDLVVNTTNQPAEQVLELVKRFILNQIK